MDNDGSVLEVHMGENFKRLDPLLKKVHVGSVRLQGTVEVKRGGILARLICTFFRFPRENPNAKLRVDCEHNRDSMVWKRDFDGLKMESNFRRQGEFLMEYLGPLAMSFKAVETNGALEYQFIKTKMFGIPIPAVLSPQVEAVESESDGKYCFSVRVKMFLIGMVISYGGTLDVI